MNVRTPPVHRSPNIEPSRDKETFCTNLHKQQISRRTNETDTASRPLCGDFPEKQLSSPECARVVPDHHLRGAPPHTPARSLAGALRPAPLPRGRAVRAAVMRQREQNSRKAPHNGLNPAPAAQRASTWPQALLPFPPVLSFPPHLPTSCLFSASRPVRP